MLSDLSLIVLFHAAGDRELSVFAPSLTKQNINTEITYFSASALYTVRIDRNLIF